MVFIGIDVAKDKHDCCILGDGGEILVNSFTITNSRSGFDFLYEKIFSLIASSENIKVGLEATGHYSYNLLGFLLDKGLATFVINPLHANLYRKSLSLRKTKTDKVDSYAIASLLMVDKSLKPYSLTSYHNEKLKSLSRYRFDKVQERAKLKTSVSRLINILFPELEKMFSTLHLNSIYALLKEFPGAKAIASAHLTRLSNLLIKASKGRKGKDTAVMIRNAACESIGSYMPAKSLELRHTIFLIEVMDSEIEEIEKEIKPLVDVIQSPIMTIPGISYRMGAVILSEISDFSQFSSPNKILAFSGLSPSTHQSGQLTSTHARMEKRGSKYLRYALFNATIYVCHWNPTFAEYLKKKRSEGKHYYVAISHAAKKLVRVMYHLINTNETFNKLV